MLLKIFLTFWLTLAVLAAGQQIVSVLSHNDEQSALNGARSLIADAQSVADAYGRGGVPAARQAAAAFERQRGAVADLLDAERHSLLGRELRPAVVAYARLADRAAAEGSRNAVVNLGERVVAKQVTTPSGGRMTLAVELPRAAGGRAMNGWTLSPL